MQRHAKTKTCIEDERRSANELNADLDRVRLWAWQWKMQFNVNKTEEVVFSCKKENRSILTFC